MKEAARKEHTDLANQYTQETDAIIKTLKELDNQLGGISKKPFLVVELGELVELVERRRPNHRILLSVAQRASSRRSMCSPTSDNITLDSQPCCNHCLCNPRWCPSHCFTRVSLSLDRVSRSFPYSNVSFNSLACYAVAILLRSVIAPPMLYHHSTR